jgi:hypothetical protein
MRVETQRREEGELGCWYKKNRNIKEGKVKNKQKMNMRSI